MTDGLHPDAEALLEANEEVPPLYEQDLSRAREGHRERSAPSGDPEPVGAVEDLVVHANGHGIPVRWYLPEGDGPFPVLVWAHGGGFVLGDVETEDAAARALTNAAGCAVASVDYRLAPEHPFPAGLRDFYAVLEWAAENAADHGGDPDRLAVGGASSGGTLAAAAALLARDRGGPAIDYQALVYPAVAYDEQFPSYEEHGDLFLTLDTMEWVDEQYLPDPLHGYNPYAYPLQADEFGGLPRATVLTAEFDPLRDEGRAYRDALSAAGVPVRYHHYDDVLHGFFGQLQEPEWERAREAVGDLGEDLRAALG